MLFGRLPAEGLPRQFAELSKHTLAGSGSRGCLSQIDKFLGHPHFGWLLRYAWHDVSRLPLQRDYDLLPWPVQILTSLYVPCLRKCSPKSSLLGRSPRHGAIFVSVTFASTLVRWSAHQFQPIGWWRERKIGRLYCLFSLPHRPLLIHANLNSVKSDRLSVLRACLTRPHFVFNCSRLLSVQVLTNCLLDPIKHDTTTILPTISHHYSPT